MRVLLIADIHGNAEALRSVIEGAGSFDEVVVLGDLLDYGPEPGEVLDIVRSLSPKLWIRGNHDQDVSGRPRCWGSRGLRAAARATRDRITRRIISTREYRLLESRPSMAVLDVGGARMLAVHGSPRNPLCGNIYPWSTSKRVSRALAHAARRIPADYVVTAHTHVPLFREMSGTLILNPGSVGQPRDGDPRSSFMVVDTETPGAARLLRTPYDVERTISKLREYGLDKRVFGVLANTLRTGHAPLPLP